MKILHNLIEEDQTNDDKSQKQTYKPQKNAKGENLPENISKVTGFVLVVCLNFNSEFSLKYEQTFPILFPPIIQGNIVIGT
jgi:hypothetical protein